MCRLLIPVFAACLATLYAQPVAVIASSDGKATIVTREGHSQAAHSLDWLPADAVLETAPGAHLVVAFSNGRRYELGPGAKISITPNGPANSSGPLRELDKLPQMPKLPVIAPVSAAGAMGGLRIREFNSARLIFPRDRLSTLPDHTTLRFDPEPGGSRHRIEIADPAGSVVFQSETEASSLSVPAGRLKPGQSYIWRLRSVSGEVLGQAPFTTLSAENIALRAAFQAAANSPVLLAAIDSQLGLVEQARDELRTRPDAAPAQLEALEDLLR